MSAESIAIVLNTVEQALSKSYVLSHASSASAAGMKFESYLL